MEDKYSNSLKLFPSLSDKNNKNRFIEFLSVEDLQVFTRKCLEKANYTLTDDDLALCEIICDNLIVRSNLSSEVHNSLVDVLLIAAMLHNTYNNENNIIESLFKPRQEFYEIGKQDDLYEFKAIPDQILEQIFQCIEAKYGELSPVPLTKPTIGSYQEIFANSFFIIKNRKRWFSDN